VWEEAVETARGENHGRFDSRTFVMAALALQERLGLDFSVAAYTKARTHAQNAPSTAVAGTV